MSYSANGYIRDYNPTSNTATVELTGLGIIDVWLDGIAINAGINPSTLVNGTPVALSIPDAHRLCEAVIVSANGTATGSPIAIAQASGVQQYLTGRVAIPTDATGYGSITASFGITFSSVPLVYAGADEPLPMHIGLPTTTGVGLSFSAGTAPANSTIFATWYAIGGH